MVLKIFLLGQFKLQAGDQALELPSRPAQSLLAYLALNTGVAQRREKLAALLWPESSETNARSYLRQALWRLRKALDSHGLKWADYLEVSDITLTFKQAADFWLDARLLLEAIPAEDVAGLIDIVRLYRGELLPGFYDEWVVAERDRLQSAYFHKMNQLLECLVAQEEWQTVIKWSEEWLRLGYAPEAAFQAMLQAYAGLGDQSMLSLTYHRCEEALERELNLEPSPQTRSLYTRLSHRMVDQPEQPARLESHARLPAFLQETGSRRTQEAVFVAREAELARLDRLLDQALSGRGQVAFITGEAGSGKTGLLEAFSSRALARHPELIIAWGNCNAHTGIGDPYLPFREILDFLTGDIEARWEAGTLSREHARRLWNTMPLCAQVLVELGSDLINTLVPGSGLLERARASSPSGGDWLARLDYLVREKPIAPPITTPSQSDLYRQYTRMVQVLARQVPMVLMVDDLQWADAGSINLLFHLGRELSGSRILFLGAYRPEEVALGRSGNRHPLAPVVHELQRMSGEDELNLARSQGRAFVDSFLDTEANRMSPSFRELLWRQTRGHPLFTIELLRGMQERGDMLKNEAGEWIEGPDLDWDAMPARVEAVIAERIDRLDGFLQTALRAASVEGEVFTAEAIAQVIGADRRELLSRLSTELDKRHRLVRAERIQRAGSQLLSSYRFRHILFQKYLYGSLDEVERVHLHERMGCALEALFTSQEDPPPAALQLARHFEAAGLPEKSIHYLLQAAERALQLSAYQQGIEHLSRGLQQLDQVPASPERDQLELALHLSFIIAWKFRGPSPQAIQALNRARDMCQELGKTADLARVLSELSIYHYVRAEYDQALNFANEALALARQAQDPGMETESHWVLGFILFCRGDYTTARSHLEQVISYYQPEQHHHALVLLRGVDAGLSALAYNACCLWCLGYPDQAQDTSQKALALAYQYEHPFTLADVICYAGCMFNAMRQDPECLRENADALLRLTRAKDLRAWQGMATAFEGEALVSLGDLDQAMERLRQGINVSQSYGTQLYRPVILRAIAQAHIQAGNPEAGLASLTEALNVSAETGERLWETELLRKRAEILANQGDETNAEANFLQAIEIAHQQAAKSWELRAATGLARLWLRQGKVKEARKILGEVYLWFSEGFDTPDLVAARDLLAEMQA